MLEDSKLEYKCNQWDGLEVQLTLSAVVDVAIREPEDGVVLEPPAVTWELAFEEKS